MKTERLIFASSLAAVAVISLFIDAKEMGLIAIGAMAGMFAPKDK